MTDFSKLYNYGINKKPWNTLINKSIDKDYKIALKIGKSIEHFDTRQYIHHSKKSLMFDVKADPKQIKKDDLPYGFRKGYTFRVEGFLRTRGALTSDGEALIDHLNSMETSTLKLTFSPSTGTIRILFK